MILTLAIVIAALLAGLAVGWLARAGAAAKAEALAAELPQLRTQLGEVISARDTALRDLAVERAAMGERAQAFEARLTELREAKEALSAQFSEVGAKLLGEAQRQFLERADQRFAQAGEKSDAQLKALLQPVETTLKRYEEGLAKVEKERVGSYEALKEAVSSLTQGNDLVRKETARLPTCCAPAPSIGVAGARSSCGRSSNPRGLPRMSISNSKARCRMASVSCGPIA